MTLTGSLTQSSSPFISTDSDISISAWSKNRDLIAIACENRVIYIFDADSGEKIYQHQHPSPIRTIAWASNDTRLVAITENETTYIHDVTNKSLFKKLHGPGISTACIAIHQELQSICFGARDGNVHICSYNDKFDIDIIESIFTGGTPVSIKYNKDGNKIAILNSGQELVILDLTNGNKSKLKHGVDRFTAIEWGHTYDQIFLGTFSGVIYLYNLESHSFISAFEGLVSPISEMSFNWTKEVLAAKSLLGYACIWHTKSFAIISLYNDHCCKLNSQTINFTKANNITQHSPNSISIKKISSRNLKVGDDEIIYSSAKIIVVGDTNAGKTHLLKRMITGRTPRPSEQGTTHGMQVFQLNPIELDSSYKLDEVHRKDIFIWDLGGQGEYRLIHQLFLHDATTAIIAIDPTRGQRALEEIEEWHSRLRDSPQGKNINIIIVGTKLDVDLGLSNRSQVLEYIKKLNITTYIETSAEKGRGINALKKAIIDSINWSQLIAASRPKQFQNTRDAILELQKQNVASIPYSDLKALLKSKDKRINNRGLEGAITQLSLQGVIAIQKSDTKIQHVILSISRIEQYAGSIIILAKDNPHGVPAVPERGLLLKTDVLPGIKPGQRLKRQDEIIITGAVIEMLVSSGICTRHEGLLIFPSLFQSQFTKPVGTRQASYISYDFSGAIDNIYTSLVSCLVLSKEYGKPRMWKHRVEFENEDEGLCGIERHDSGGGYSRLELFFDDETIRETKESFILFVEDFLTNRGINISERLELYCECGKPFSEIDIKFRIQSDKKDIGCTHCDKRVPISEGAIAIRKRNPLLESTTWELHSTTEEITRRAASTARTEYIEASESKKLDKYINILHLSDLHFGTTTDPDERLQPLISDLTRSKTGLSVNRIDYIVISGDITQQAAPGEFAQAYKFISSLINHFKLTAEKCIICPGNHDLSWEEEVYDTRPNNTKFTSNRPSDSFSVQGKVILIRNEENYPNRFNNFDKHLYHPLYQKPYPVTPNEQFQVYDHPHDKLQFLSLNSSTMIDMFFPERSGINNNAISAAILAAERLRPQAPGQQEYSDSILRIAVFHHPISGNASISDTAFVHRLYTADTKIILHGHSHDLTINVDKLKQSPVLTIGAGSMGARANDRPESTPKLYNLIQIKNNNDIRIHVRQMAREGAGWDSYPVFPIKNTTAKSGDCKFTLSDTLDQ